VGPFLEFVHLMSLAIWIGGLVLLFVVVSPGIYRVLSDELAHTLDYHIQSGFAMIAPACGVGALVSLIAMALSGAPVGWFWLRASLLVVMTMLALHASWSLAPRAISSSAGAEAFDPRPDAEENAEQEDRRQQISGQMNGVVLLLGLIVLWLSVGGPRI
jgi:uncharacterized membrane protein